MPAKALLLVHGMGVYPPPKDKKPGKFGKEFLDATKESIQAFKNHKADEIGKHVEIFEFNYDSWLDHMRNTMADKARKMRDRLDDIGNHYKVSVPVDLVGRLVSFESDFSEDDFFYTHWLDVIFYGSMLGGNIRVKAGLEIAKLIQKYGSGNLHIFAHSLGTAVVHDTLDRLYRPEHDPNDEIPDLDPVDDRLGSVWMFANVSRLVNSVTKFSDPYSSIVRPGGNGCMNQFVNIRHEMDPFTWAARFDPSNNNQWIDTSTYSNAYDNIVTNLVVNGNTHSFTQYLQDPAVVSILLPRFVKNLKISKTEFKQVSTAYEKTSISGAYAALEEAFSNLSLRDEVTWRNFLETAKALKVIAKKIKDNLE